jgi:type III restriction enzyme
LVFVWEGQPVSLSVPTSRDASVEKWLKPGWDQFRIDYRSGESYEPDFVIQTKVEMLVCEVNEQRDR